MTKQDRPVEATGRHLIWDLPLRLFHWLLVAGIGLLWLTQYLGYDHLAEIPAWFNTDWMTIHMKLGYGLLGLLVFRVLWGFVGPRHARFRSFFPSPRRIVAYVSGAAKPVGHNPLGAMMVFLMLALVGTQAVTGLFTTDDVLVSGPFHQVSWLGPKVIALLGSLHHHLFNYILGAIALHLLAIGTYAVVFKQNLVGPMIHGHKQGASEGIPSSRLRRAAIMIVLSGAFVYGLLLLAPTVEQSASLY